jgi:hypothetical protein
LEYWEFILTLARVDLGISVSELRTMTPRFFFKLVERLKLLDRPKNYTIELMVGQLIAMTANTGFRGFKQPKLPSDFMPSQVRKLQKSAKVKRSRSSRRQVAQQVRQFFDGIIANQR